ncbi:MAG: flagellar type III secretion system pore protein FliP [Alphaproteobacteria bacterium]|nr:MAG: flagellar type III secretion system pore protein FliP [Alphaproteobacteria bacterium]
MNPWLRRFAFVGTALAVGLIADTAMAQSLTLDLGGGGQETATARIIQILLLVTVLALAPSLLMMVTSFTRVVVVLSFLRSAIGLQQTPPNMVLLSLALFLTGFIMAPTFQQAYDQSLRPLSQNEITEEVALERGVVPFRNFMLKHTREKDLALFFELGKTKAPTKAEETPLQILIPAFMISELRRAFEIGFLLFLPFLVIDMVIASVLMAMGMMMLPPVVISLPFKIIFFVLVDGWYLIAGSLVKSYGGAG